MYGKYLLVAVFVAVFAAALAGEQHKEKHKKFQHCLEENNVHYTWENYKEAKKNKELLCGEKDREQWAHCMFTSMGEYDGNNLDKEKILEHFRGYEEDKPALEKCINEAQEKEPFKKPCHLMDCKMLRGIRCWKKEKHTTEAPENQEE